MFATRTASRLFTNVATGTLLAGGLAVAVPALADEPASPHTFTANVGVYSQYIFRGLTQTNEKPALQGGFDYAHASGFYAGTWLSNISWFSDTNTGTTSSIEMDLYAGYRKSLESGFSFDFGVLRYQYPGEYPNLAPGTVKPNTTEIYVLGGYKWATLKYSHAVSDTFGVDDSKNTNYLDLTVTVPFAEKFAFIAHYGKQTFKGTSAFAGSIGTDNDSLYSYDDWRVALTYAFAPSWTLTAQASDTNAEDAGYTVLGKNLGDSAFVIGLSRAF